MTDDHDPAFLDIDLGIGADPTPAPPGRRGLSFRQRAVAALGLAMLLDAAPTIDPAAVAAWARFGTVVAVAALAAGSVGRVGERSGDTSEDHDR